MSKRRIWCPWRRSMVPVTPEELVRLELLRRLVDTLGFPASGIAVERELSTLLHPGSAQFEVPKRRVDIVCFAASTQGGGLYPLLLIECKAVQLTLRMRDQVVGYNHHVGASFVALVNQFEAQIGWFDPQLRHYHFLLGLPNYGQLLAWRDKHAQLLRPSRDCNGETLRGDNP